MRREVFAGLLPELRARAITVAGIESLSVVSDIRDRIAELPAGGDWKAIKKDLVRDLSPYLVDPDADDEERAAQQNAAERRAELLLRTHGFQAYQSASYQVMDRLRDVFPYWQYDSQGDHKVRATHAALNGIVLPADSPFWQGHIPPWQWGCRCQIIPLLPEEVEDMREAEANLPIEKRKLLAGPALAELENNRRLVRGPNEIYDLRNDREKGNPQGFYFDPADLRLRPEDLKARYSDKEWSDFEGWAQRTPIGDDAATTVWDWMSGASILLASTSRSAARLPGIMLPVAVPPRVDPTSGKLTIPETHPDHAALVATLTVIDSVHDDGRLSAIPLIHSTAGRTVGLFEWSKRTGKALRITISSQGPYPELTLIHEIGHWIYQEALSKADARRIAAMLDKTAAAKALRYSIRTGRSKPGGRRDLIGLDDFREMLQPEEMFSRAYTQWIARRSAHERLLAQITHSNADFHELRNFSDADFLQIDKALSEAFDLDPLP